MNWQVIELVAQHKLHWNTECFGPWTFFSCNTKTGEVQLIALNESHFTSFCITAEEGARTETFCIPVKFMLCYKLNNLPVHHRHTAMNLYEITVEHVHAHYKMG